MTKTNYIFQADSLYREFRERRMGFGVDLPYVAKDGVRVYKIDFVSNNSGCLLPEDQNEIENTQFPYILFLHEGTSQFDEVLIILNGLNESEYRKFFPWAASFARSGIPTIVFPIAFLINRRPRRWFIPKDLEKMLEVRRSIEGNSACTPYNVVLSERLDRYPQRFLLAGIETYKDLFDLGNIINSGEYTVKLEGKIFNPFIKGTRIHFVGYSLGGYLALILLMGKKDEPIFSETRLIVFCSGAAINNRQSDLNANPTSPLILDKSASERLISFYKNGETFPLISKEEGRLFKAIFLGEKNILNSELNSLKGRIKIIGSEKDRVIPIEGMERNLGWVDEDLKLGIHEYPFSVRSLDNPNLEREMAGSCNVGEEFQGVFKRFVDCVIKKLKD